MAHEDIEKQFPSWRTLEEFKRDVIKPHDEELDLKSPHDYSNNFTSQNEGVPGGKDGMSISFNHIAGGGVVSFKAFITTFEDNYESQWNEEEVFGRMDPISTFQRTRRRISLGWVVPSFSYEEARVNMQKAERFLSMLYPVYEENDNFNKNGESVALDQHGDKRVVSTMVAPPLIKMKFANLIMDTKNGSVVGSVRESGLVGTIAGLSYRPDIEQGFFSSGEGRLGRNPDPKKYEKHNGYLIPQTINFDVEFVVHHQHGLGFNGTSLNDNKGSKANRRVKSFPYKVDNIMKPKQ